LFLTLRKNGTKYSNLWIGCSWNLKCDFESAVVISNYPVIFTEQKGPEECKRTQNSWKQKIHNSYPQSKPVEFQDYTQVSIPTLVFVSLCKDGKLLSTLRTCLITCGHCLEWYTKKTLKLWVGSEGKNVMID
jgi:hypothetical protein